MAKARKEVISKVYMGHETEQRLITAAGDGDLSTVLKLVRKRISLTTRDDQGHTALARASEGESH